MASGLNTARLYSQLQITGLSQSNQPLFQLIRSLIGDVISVDNKSSGGSGGGGGGGNVVINEINQTIQQILGDDNGGGGDSDVIPGPPGSIGATGATGASGSPGGITFMFGQDGLDGEVWQIPGNQGIQGPAGATGSGAWTFVKKTSDTSRNNNAGSGANVVVADPELTFALAANTAYAVRGVFFIELDEANLGNRLVHQFTGPASPTLISGEIRRTSTGLTYTARAFNAFDTTNQNADGQGTAASDQKGLLWFDILIQNGANAGNFTFNWISGSSTAASAIVRKGSYLEWAPIA